MYIGAGMTRLKMHQLKKREMVKRERSAIRQLIEEKEYEVARAKASSCIRDELLCEAYAILEVLLSQCKQRLELLNMYKYVCRFETIFV